MKTAGVVVVTYNSGPVIDRCLDSCNHLPAIVVDNASTDDTVKRVRGRLAVKMIANSTNRGFAAAVNQGVSALDTELVLLMNPDVELVTPIDQLIEACSRNGVGLAGGKLIDEHGEVQSGFTLRRFPTPLTLAFEVLGINRVFPSNPVNRRYRCLDMDLSRPAEADQPPGAFLMFRREVWQRLGGFDTQFDPIWFEDVDFAKRARDLGLKILYVPEVIARHHGGHSIRSLDWSRRQLCWYASLLSYASKHFRPYACRGVSTTVLLGAIFRAPIEVLRYRSLGPVKVYAQVAQLGGRHLIGCRGGYRTGN